jgi:hypothetical protein
MSSYSEWVPIKRIKPFDTHNLFLQSIDTCFLLYWKQLIIVQRTWICFISLGFFIPTWFLKRFLIAAHNQHELPKIQVFLAIILKLFYIYTKLIKVPMELFFIYLLRLQKRKLSL